MNGWIVQVKGYFPGFDGAVKLPVCPGRASGS